MPQVNEERQSGIGEAFAKLQTGAIGEFGGGDLFASLEFDAEEAQNGCVAAGHPDFAPGEKKRSGRNYGDFLSRVVRHRLAQEVAGLATESGVRAGPGGKSADAIEDLLGG